MNDQVSLFRPENEKVCRICGMVKPLTEFYRHWSSADELTTECKTCFQQTLQERKRRRITREPTSTRDARAILLSRGIPTVTGKAANMPWVDLVAWACVPIEAKGSRVNGGYYHWTFSERQINGTCPDLVYMLIGYKRDYSIAHIFIVPPSQQIAVNRYAFTARPNGHARYGTITNWGWLQTYQNAFDIIEGMRLEFSVLHQERTEDDILKSTMFTSAKVTYAK